MKRDKFATSEDGRMVFNESSHDDNNGQGQDGKEGQEDFYKQSLESEGAFTRTASGRIKFLDGGNSSSARGKKRSLEEDEELGAHVGTDWRHKNMNKKSRKGDMTLGATNRMLGRQYKATKAGGDIKRRGMADPHAYIPLSGQIVGNKRKSAQTTTPFKKILTAAAPGSGRSSSSSLSVSGKSGGSGSRPPLVSRGNKKHRK